jgi:putative transposase
LALEDDELLAEQLILRDQLRFAEREIGGGAEEEGRASGLSQPPEGLIQKTEQMGDVLLAFYDLAGVHWIHLRTTNPIESTFATVRLRQRVTKGPGSRAAGIAMAFKLVESAQHRWRAVNSAHLVALVRAGARCANGHLIERPDESGGEAQAA